MHGSRSLSGVASPSFKSGRYSKVLPTQLAERYRTALDDTELLVLRDEIALIDAHLSKLVAQSSGGEASAAWSRLRRGGQELAAALGAKDQAALMSAARQLLPLIEAGATASEQWQDILGCMEQRRKLVDTEQKRLQRLDHYITVPQASALLARIGDILKTRVTQHFPDRAESNPLMHDVSSDIRALTKKLDIMSEDHRAKMPT